MNRVLVVIMLGSLVVLPVLAMWRASSPGAPHAWGDAEVALLESLAIDGLPPMPPEPSNAVADDPKAAAFGRRLFFDRRLSKNEAFSCATCHRPELRFTDGLPRGRALGESDRNTQSLIGAAYSSWQYWDGRKDSLWSQALSPLEHSMEQGATRTQIVHLIAQDAEYREAYEALFGHLPDVSDSERFPSLAAPVGNASSRQEWENMTAGDRRKVNVVFSNVGKAIAAYERLLVPGPARFDRYVQAALKGDLALQREIFTADEAQGLRLFIGKARCVECHNGPLFTNNEFHNTGVLPSPGDAPDLGRANGLTELRSDPFNCDGAFSDDPRRSCPELRFVCSGNSLIGAFRTPSLRNVDGTAPFMHNGQLTTLEQVIDHYNSAPPAMIGHNEAKPLFLSREQRDQLVAFLETLAAPPATPREWLTAP